MTDWQKRAEELEIELRAVRAQRDDARGALSQRIALRRDIEEMLGVESAPVSDEQLARGVEAAKALRARAENAERKLAALHAAAANVQQRASALPVSMTEIVHAEEWDALDEAIRDAAPVAERHDREVEARVLRRMAEKADAGWAGPAAALLLRDEADRIERGPSSTPHAHPRDVPAVLAHEARGAVGDEESETEGGPRGHEVG